MSSILSENTIAKFEASKKILLRIAIWTMVGGVVLGAILILVDGSDSNTSEWSGRFGMLSGFVAFAWIIMVIVALVISSSEKRRLSAVKKNSENVSTSNSVPNNNVLNGPINNNTNGVTTKTESELRAEIEEKVRREMIEKEVREQFVREHNQNNQQ